MPPVVRHIRDVKCNMILRIARAMLKKVTVYWRREHGISMVLCWFSKKKDSGVPGFFTSANDENARNFSRPCCLFERRKKSYPQARISRSLHSLEMTGGTGYEVLSFPQGWKCGKIIKTVPFLPCFLALFRKCAVIFPVNGYKKNGTHCSNMG